MSCKQVHSWFFNTICTETAFTRLSECYHEQFELPIFVHDANGQLIYGSSTLSPKQCRFAAQETLRWGETTIHYNKTCGKLYWSVPLMLNNQLIGGLAVCEVPFGDEATSEERLTRIRKAATGLLDLTVRENFIAESTLREALERSRTEQEKAEAIHLLKNRFYTSIQTVYTEKEPALLSAIRRGEREEAIQMLNEIFVVIYHYGASSQELLKSYLLELVAMMSRAAVEAGSQTENALGLNFQSITQLAALEDDEAIAAWLSDILERLFTQIQSNRDHPHSVAFNKAFSYMDAHLSDNLKREDVARHVGLSSSHFAHLLSTYTGKSFRKILTELRVEKAAQLLRHSQLSLTEIAFECGFSDQSHFSRVFSKATSHSPGDYRKQGIQLPNLE